MASATKDEEKDKSISFDSEEFDLDKLSLYEDLPTEIWELIFIRLKNEKICELRLVCKLFNQIGKKILEKGKSKVGSRLTQHLEFTKSELITSGDSLNVNATKYIFLYFLMKSRDKICNLFRQFIGKDAVCFTLGKMIDFLLSFLMVLEDDEIWDHRYLNFRRVITYWRKCYDKYQMKFMGEFDYCLWMWLRFVENSTSYCHPVDQLLHLENCCNWEEMTEYLAKDSWEDLISFNIGYTYAFKPNQNEERSPFDYDEEDDFFGADEEENYGSLDLLLNEHWTPYKPPPMDEECILLFQKYLL